MAQPNLSVGSFGDEVSALHDKLSRAGLDPPASEVTRNFFGPGTRQAIQQLQHQQGLRVTGEVDASTHAALAGVVAGSNVPVAPTTPSVVAPPAISRIPPATAASVVAAGNVPVAATSTSANAPVAIGRIPPGTGVAGGILPPSIGAGGLAAPPHTGNGTTGVGSGAAPAANRVAGRILLDHGLAALDVTIRAYNRGLGGDTLLGETKTDELGSYTLPYGAMSGAINLQLRAVDAQGNEVPLTETKYGASPQETLNLIAPANIQPLAPEYQRLTADLISQFGSLDKLATAREDADRQDLTVIYAATGWDARLLGMAATATSVARDTGISPDGLYALFRAGLPADKTQLAFVGPNGVSQALNAAKNAGIVALSDQQMADLNAAYQKFAVATLQVVRAPGAVSSYGDLFSKSGLNDAEKQSFAQLYFANVRAADGLWDKAQAQGIARDKIDGLRLQGKLAYLTSNSANLVASLQQDIGRPDQVANLVENDLYQSDAWKARLRKIAGTDNLLAGMIPERYGGEKTADRLEAYAADLARRVRMSFPTRVVARMVEKGDIRLGAQQTAVTTFLKNAINLGYELGRTPVDSFVAQNSDKIFSGVTTGDTLSTTESVKLLHRMYQITPSNESLKTLIDLGFSSAFEITRLPFDIFLSRYGQRFPSFDEARLVYRKAQQVSVVTFNFFSAVKQIDTGPAISSISPTSDRREEAKNNIIKRYPRMESLFGSLDFCECEECRSVLGPAAYFVDLLHFLDYNPMDWQGFLAEWKSRHNNTPYPFQDQSQRTNFLNAWRAQNGGRPDPNTEKTPYDVFVERRPDLPNLPLTCENTNTAMPYIDIVNEILEYYVVNDALKANSGNDTGDATTPELIAEPQNILPAAYDKLEKARYPLTLPFDLWLETVRRFLEYFDVKLWQVLDVFRPSDDLFAPAADAKAYYRANVFAEFLGLSPSEYAIFTDPDAAANWFGLYGYDKEADALADLKSAKALARRLSITYQDLVDLVLTGFVNPRLNTLTVLQKLGIQVNDVFRYKRDPNYQAMSAEELAAFEKRLTDLTTMYQGLGFDARAWLDKAWLNGDFNQVLLLADPDTGCSFEHTTLRYANGADIDAIALAKLNLFVRLWKKLGWKMEEIDRALQVCTAATSLPLTLANIGPAFKSVLLYLAHLEDLNQQLPIGRDSRFKLLTLWSRLPTTGTNPLYGQLFLRPTVLKNDPVFDDPLGNYLSNPGVLLKDHLLAIQAALSLTADQISKVLSDAGQDPNTAVLSLDNVSLLYRYGLLAKGLRISVDDLITLKRLAGLNPFKSLRADPVASIADDYPFCETIQFVKVVAVVKESAFTVEDLNYILRHDFDPVGKYRQDPNVQLSFVKALASGLRRIATENAVPSDANTLTDDLLQQKLALVLPPDAVGVFMGMWTGTIVYDAVQSNVAAANKLEPAAFAQTPAIQVTYDAVRQAQRLTFKGVLLDAQLSQLQASNPSPLLAALLANVRAQQQDFYDKYLGAFLTAADYQKVFAPLPTGLTDTAQQTAMRTKRAILATSFLPFLQRQLTRQLAVQVLASDLNGDPSLTEALLVNPGLLSDPTQANTHVLDAFAALAVGGVDARFYTSVDGSGTPVATTRAPAADTIGKPAGINSAHFEGYFEMPSPGPYRFSIELAKKNSHAELRLDFLPDPLIRDTAANDGAELSAYTEFKAGVPYHFALDVRNLGGGDATLLVQGEGLPNDAISQLTLYTRTSVDRAVRARILLAKMFQFIQTLPLDERELRYLAAHPDDFDGLNFSQLPTASSDSSPALAAVLFKQLLRLVVYAQLKRDLAGGNDDLVGIFDNARRKYPASADANQAKSDMLNDLSQRVADLTRRDPANVRSAATQLGFLPQSTVNGGVLAIQAPGFAQEKGIQKLWNMLQVIEKLGVSADAVVRWASPAPGFSVARDLRDTVKARYDPETWRLVAKAIFDKLRRLQRNALVDYIIIRKGFDNPDQLFEYFLIDPGMEPVVQTSRLRLAISAVQTFIQRCLLNLEPEVQPSALNSDHWQWMKRYRVWEANRKIFLFPENWLEPEFRDDKTELYQTLEGALL
jgi:peptidoglycan hydrolase-like protein with peptidoglycan-binding domain